MEILRDVFLVLHLLGFAAIIAGFLTQTRTAEKQITAGVLHGALTQLVTGVALVGIAEAGDGDVNHTKIAVKLVVLLVIAGLALWGRRKRSVPKGAWIAVGALTVLNVVVAVVW